MEALSNNMFLRLCFAQTQRPRLHRINGQSSRVACRKSYHEGESSSAARDADCGLNSNGPSRHVPEPGECGTAGAPQLKKKTNSKDLKLSLTRRQAALLAAGTWLLVAPSRSEAAPAFLERGLGKYVKKKKLDPLETYVPTVLLTIEQLQTIKKVVQNPDSDEDAIAAVRFLLRSGPAASFRMDVRAIAQYAEEAGAAGSMGTPSGDAELCISTVGNLDYVMRTEPMSGREKMLRALGEIQTVVERLLDTVPGDVLRKSRDVADAALGKSAPVAQGDVVLSERLADGKESGEERPEEVPPNSKVLSRRSDLDILEKIL